MISSHMLTLLVLFSNEDNVWKLGDFGLVAEGTSNTAKTTSRARGTPCYRAPELVRESSAFSRKTDIWALGCILHELVFSKKAFDNDYKVFEFASSDKQFELTSEQMSSVDESSMTKLSTIILKCLDRDFQRRPSAGELRLLFSAQLNHPSFNLVNSVVQATVKLPGNQDINTIDFSTLSPEDVNLLALKHPILSAVDNKTNFLSLIPFGSTERENRISTMSHFRRNTRRNYDGNVSYGQNSRGNSYAGTGNAYRYSNRDGSYYYRNPDGSEYYNNGKGFSQFTP
jgi:serine/threonine protein kinase